MWSIRNADDEAIFKEIDAQSDRGAAIIAVAFLEDRLLDAINFHFSQFVDIKTQAVQEEFQGMFRGSMAPLGSYSSRIKLGYLMGIYGRDALADLKTIGKIRNDFAHSKSPITFETLGVKDKCKNLLLPEQIMRDLLNPQPGMIIPPDLRISRNRFIYTAQMLLMLFLRQSMRIENHADRS